MSVESAAAAWSPYLVGVLSMASFYFSDKPLGVSTSYARVAGLIGNIFSKQHTETLKFYQDKKPKIEWGVMLMFGVIVGAFLAASTGGELTRTWVPALWEELFRASALLRSVAKYEVLMGQFFLTDFTVIRIILTAITVGMVGVFSMHAMGLVKLHVKLTRYATNATGGLLFGVGLGLLGYCPGTGGGAGAGQL